MGRHFILPTGVTSSPCRKRPATRRRRRRSSSRASGLRTGPAGSTHLAVAPNPIRVRLGEPSVGGNSLGSRRCGYSGLTSRRAAIAPSLAITLQANIDTIQPPGSQLKTARSPTKIDLSRPDRAAATTASRMRPPASRRHDGTNGGLAPRTGQQRFRTPAIRYKPSGDA